MSGASDPGGGAARDGASPGERGDAGEESAAARLLALEKRRLRVVEVGGAFTYPHDCGYLPGLAARTEDRTFLAMSPEGYEAMLRAGYRRFGAVFFRPRCASCERCISLRVLADRFAWTRRWRRVLEANRDVRAEVGPFRADGDAAEVAREFFAARSLEKGWAPAEPVTVATYRTRFGGGPIPVQEVRFFRGGRLLGVGIFDDLPGGETAIVFHWRAEWRRESPGTFNILWLIRRALERGRPFVYLGYYVPGSRSMAYKAQFRPAELLREGRWRALE